MFTSTATANPVLAATLYNFARTQNDLVGMRIAPIFLSSVPSGAYYIFSKENVQSIPRNIKRAATAPYARTTAKFSSDSFSCEETGIEELVDDAERAKYAIAFSADEAAMNRVANTIMMNHELDVYDLATGAGTPTSAITGAAWNDYTNPASNPVVDIDVIRELIHTSTGLDPNLLVLSRDVFNAVKEHPKILDKYKYTQPGNITVELLAAAFGIKEIILAGAISSGAAENLTAPTPGLVWSGKVWIGHSETSNDLQAPNFARTFIWAGQTGPDGVAVETYREQARNSDVHRARQWADKKITGSSLGYQITGVLG